jgi:hypothetical protein
LKDWFGTGKEGILECVEGLGRAFFEGNLGREAMIFIRFILE